MLFVETSAKTNTNVDALFDLITKDVLRKKMPIVPNGVHIAPEQPFRKPDKNNCC